MNKLRFIFVLIFLLIAYNLYQQSRYLAFYLDKFQNLRNPPGADFVNLSPYLKGVKWVGYRTDILSPKPSKDAGIYFSYQQAQFALSPLLLDLYDPMKHEYLILNFKDKLLERQLIVALNASLIASTPSGVLLVRKDR